MNELLLIVGRTGAGKSTIAKRIAKIFERPIVKSYTTRPMRDSEDEETADHIFIDQKDIGLYEDDFAAYTKIGKYEYFVTWSLLEDYASKGAIYVIDPIGVYDLRDSIKKLNKDIKLRILYVRADPQIRMNRAKKRGDNPSALNDRIEAEKAQFDCFEKSIDLGREEVLIIDNNIENPNY